MLQRCIARCEGFLPRQWAVEILHGEIIGKPRGAGKWHRGAQW
jgi:hypothetical protein